LGIFSPKNGSKSRENEQSCKPTASKKHWNTSSLGKTSPTNWQDHSEPENPTVKEFPTKFIGFLELIISSQTGFFDCPIDSTDISTT
jgi:hypothetical protein